MGRQAAVDAQCDSGIGGLYFTRPFHEGEYSWDSNPLIRTGCSLLTPVPQEPR